MGLLRRRRLRLPATREDILRNASTRAQLLRLLHTLQHALLHSVPSHLLRLLHALLHPVPTHMLLLLHTLLHTLLHALLHPVPAHLLTHHHLSLLLLLLLLLHLLLLRSHAHADLLLLGHHVARSAVELTTHTHHLLLMGHSRSAHHLLRKPVDLWHRGAAHEPAAAHLTHLLRSSRERSRLRRVEEVHDVILGHLRLICGRCGSGCVCESTPVIGRRGSRGSRGSGGSSGGRGQKQTRPSRQQPRKRAQPQERVQRAPLREHPQSPPNRRRL